MNSSESKPKRAHRLFQQAFPLGQMNILTPDVIYRTMRGGRAVELSRGTGMDGEPIFGVTVVDGRGKPSHDMSRCFTGPTARPDAEAYIESLGHTHDEVRP